MPILTFLHGLPEWAVYVVLLLPITAGIVLMPHVGRYVFGLGPDEDRSKGAVEAFKAIVASLAFLLAFTLAQAQTAMRTDEGLVAQEAAALNTMDRSLLRYNSSDFLELRKSLHELIRLIYVDEWPALAHAQRSRQAEAIVDLLSRRLRTTEAGTPRQQSLLNELIAKLDEFTDKREELIQSADTFIAPFFWYTIGAIICVLLALSLFVTPNRERVLTMAGITAAVTLVMGLVVIIDAPFSGGAQISSAPIQRVYGLVQARQQNPALNPVN
jgi:tetrahydromethanopterin S-methyltransferase subunit B